MQEIVSLPMVQKLRYKVTGGGGPIRIQGLFTKGMRGMRRLNRYARVVPCSKPIA